MLHVVSTIDHVRGPGRGPAGSAGDVPVVGRASSPALHHEVVAQFINQMPNCAALYSPCLSRILYANAAATRQLLPALSGQGKMAAARTLEFDSRIRRFIELFPSDLPLRVSIRIAGLRTVAEFHGIYGADGRDAGRLVRWPS